MTALDANVLLRLILDDDPDQRSIAEQLIEETVLVPLTVLLEAAWVLRSRYRFGRSDIAAMLRAVLDGPTVVIEAPSETDWALGRYQLRGDLADLMHIVAARSATSFATFDKAVAKAAGEDAPVPVRTLA